MIQVFFSIEPDLHPLTRLVWLPPPGMVTTPVKGHLIPMAIPLRAPRQGTATGPPPGLPIPSTPQADTSSPFASTPLENHVTPRPQVSLSREEHEEEASPQRQGEPAPTPVQHQDQVRRQIQLHGILVVKISSFGVRNIYIM